MDCNVARQQLNDSNSFVSENVINELMQMFSMSGRIHSLQQGWTEHRP